MYSIDQKFAIPKNKTLTCIIPLRLCDEKQDALIRLRYFREDDDLPDTVGFLVVDDGSAEEFSAEISNICRKENMGYIHIDSGNQIFSVGRCRNVGAMHADSRYVLMHDVDLIPFRGFYRKLLTEIDVQRLSDDAKQFLMVPYVFLTEQGTDEYFHTPRNMREQLYQHYAVLNDARRVEKTSTGTSANVYTRMRFLACGGNHPDFQGWGYEDLEFNCRMIRHLHMYPVPEEWAMQKWNFANIVEYKSWKAVYRLFGDTLFMKGIYFSHAWHPGQEHGVNTYLAQADTNRGRFFHRMNPYAKPINDPEPLPDLSGGIRRTLLMKSCAFTYSRTFAPLLGEIVEPTAELLSGETALEDFLKQHSITQIIFHNPYSTPEMNHLYRKARELRFPYFVGERGALPRSAFFDPSGFLMDSDSYKRERWDRDPGPEKRRKVIEYMASLTAGQICLERQMPKIGVGACREKLGIKPYKKILFVAMQRPGDSVTTHFCGSLGSYDNFIFLLRTLSVEMPPEWVMVVKKHPLEDDLSDIQGSISTTDMNIHDLLDLADVVLTFNSGVGVLAMAHQTPTIVAGDAFYHDERINTHATTAPDIVDLLQSPKPVDMEAAIRFYSYLLHEFYSFGNLVTKDAVLPDGHRMTATMDIEFEAIRGLSKENIYLSQNKKTVVSWNSMLFDRYRFSMSRNTGSQAMDAHVKTSGFFRRLYGWFGRKYRSFRLRP